MTKNNIALVTGASSGIGKEIAKKLLKDGYKVYVAARRMDKMKDIEQLGALPLKMDITIDQDIEHVVNTINNKDGGIDVLVNNAGFGIYGAMEDISMEEAKNLFNVNIFGLARLTQLVLPFMRDQKHGTIVNIASMAGKMYFPLGSWYHASKHALEGWSDCLRLELATFNIKVIIIEPGVIETEFSDVVLNHMIQKSGKSSYAPMVNKMKKSFEKSYKPGSGTPPSVIANTISEALKSSHPKIRYTVGKYAKLTIFARKWFGDKIFDKVITKFN